MKKYKEGVSFVILAVTVIIMSMILGVMITSMNDTKVLVKSKNTVNNTSLYQAQQVATSIWTEAHLARDINIDEAYIREKLNEYNIDADKFDIEILNNGVKLSIK